MQIGAPVELARLLLGVQRLADGVDGLVEVRRREVGAEGIHRAQREGMGLTGGDEAAPQVPSASVAWPRYSSKVMPP